ncbi:hypothetical protein Tco_0233880 [Tanacetum coccineum]
MEFCDKHNMVAFLQKPYGSEDFHQIVDFLAGNHIRYALTANPTIYVSLVEQFWQTATVETDNDGEQQINVTVDGHTFAITEASVRRHLQLADVDGIGSLPNTDIFEQLTLIGHVFTDDKLTFKKAKFSPQWRFLIHTILHCLSPKKTSWEQFSSNIATVIICLATNRTFKFSQLIFDGMVKNMGSKTIFLMYPRFIQIFLNKKKRFLNKHKAIYVAHFLTQKLFSNMKLDVLTDLCTKLVDRVTNLEKELKQTKEVHGKALSSSLYGRARVPAIFSLTVAQNASTAHASCPPPTRSHASCIFWTVRAPQPILLLTSNTRATAETVNYLHTSISRDYILHPCSIPYTSHASALSHTQRHNTYLHPSTSSHFSTHT